MIITLSDITNMYILVCVLIETDKKKNTRNP